MKKILHKICWFIYFKANIKRANRIKQYQKNNIQFTPEKFIKEVLR